MLAHTWLTIAHVVNSLVHHQTLSQLLQEPILFRLIGWIIFSCFYFYFSPGKWPITADFFWYIQEFMKTEKKIVYILILFSFILYIFPSHKTHFYIKAVVIPVKLYGSLLYLCFFSYLILLKKYMFKYAVSLFNTRCSIGIRKNPRLIVNLIFLFSLFYFIFFSY